MSERIELDEMQAGDVIRIQETRQVTVEAVNTLARTVETTDGARFGETTLKGWERTFKLIDRPLPPLPTDAGSVVSVGRSRYFLTVSPGGEMLWVYEGGQRTIEPRNRVQMAAYAEKHGGFEVLL